jgi:uncharacterized protein (DUF1501 family)
MNTKLSRREFLQRASALSAAGIATPWALNLAAIGEAAAQSASDYKALVCVFLYGGNDYANTLIPYDAATYNAYQAQRPDLAITRDALAATRLAPTLALPNAREYALAPSLAPLKAIFDAGHMTALLNAGPLMQPTSKTEYQNKSVPLPPKLFSHNDQQSVWQASNPEGASSGWGGRIGDLFAAGQAGAATFTNISVSGNAVFLSGKSAAQYQVTPGGAVPIRALQAPLFGSTACSDALRELITAARSHLFEAEHTRVVARSISASDQLSSALAGLPGLTTVFPADNGLAAQLAMVAKIIAARTQLGVKRQVFLVSLGGFDTHAELLNTHPALLTEVGAALQAFYQATQELSVAEQVTTFTASDFGRTLTSNGDGSDHGWGSYHFVIGDAVKGGQFYGAAPEYANNGADDVGQGRLIPTTSVDQLAATLATWFGVAAGDLPLVVPNIGSFTQTNLGFLA